MDKLDLSKYHRVLDSFSSLRHVGEVVQIIGLTIEANGPPSSIGDLCYIYPSKNSPPLWTEVVGFREDKVLLMPYGELGGLKPGALVVNSGKPMEITVGSELLGRVLNGLGQPIDKNGPLNTSNIYSTTKKSINPLLRKRITEPIALGVKAIDSFITVGKGQRVGVFAGSGVGKSSVLAMIARNTNADMNVIGLIGERGREVREFIENSLGAEGLSRSVLVVVTSDQPALMKIKAAQVATTIAEYFRDGGRDVLFLLDSITRVAMAYREVGLAIGEPPATRGYTPSVFANLPKILERSGTSDKGTITGLYTVLVEGDDFNEPVSDTVRGILDGHIALSRELAEQNHYPAIDILGSISRVMVDITDSEHQKSAGKIKDLLASYNKAKDLINIGAYVKGTDPKIDKAIDLMPKLNDFLIQPMEKRSDYKKTIEYLIQMAQI
ncbi:MAG: flagellar protein export ATPase FliI [Cyanobacteriota bacterium]